jgi:murein DD-endopeptidase MepM/ murein hydrolase activator NlpD
MPDINIYRLLKKFRRSTLFRDRFRTFNSTTVALFIAFFSGGFLLFFSGYLLSASASNSPTPPTNPLVSSIQNLYKSIGLISDDELGVNDESEQVTIDEGENDPGHRIEKRSIRKGDSIYTILTAAGLTPAEVHQLAAQLKGNRSIRNLRVGKTYEIETGRNGEFISFSVKSTPYEILHLVKDEQTGELSVQQEAIEYDTRIATIEGTLRSSLATELRGRNRGSLNHKIRKILSSRLDFRRDIHPGATYRILFQEMWDESHCVGTGDILAVEISSKGRNFKAYQFTNTKGDTAYYDEKGRPMMQGHSVFIKPCRYSRVSSGFGYRTHPITGSRQFHGGVDLAAPTGTPVRAVADGRIIYRGSKGLAGNLVTIAHGQGLHTMYLHLSRYGSKCRYGQRVKQGDIIGYVGSTGRSTGPHLDFRIVKNGRLKNPLVALKQTAPRRSLSPAERHSFMAKMQAYHQQLGGERPVMVADTGKPGEPVL